MICQTCRAALRAHTTLRASTTSTILTQRALSSPRPTSSLTFKYSNISSSNISRSSSRSFTTTTPRALPESDPPSMTPTESSIASRLSAALSPSSVLVQDVSGGCGSMYAIDISAESFRGQTVLKQQRMVNAALGELVKGWHGVQIKTRVPDA